MTPAGRAACADEDPELFYPHSETSGPGLLQIAEAVAVCNRCPIRDQCLEDKLAEEGGRDYRNRHGIFGGRTAKERHRLYRVRRRVSETAAVA